jgi:maleate cis-trans isomerase
VLEAESILEWEGFCFHRGRFQTRTIPVSELVGVEFTLEWDGLLFSTRQVSKLVYGCLVQDCFGIGEAKLN